MPRHQSRAASGVPSQRALRAGELVRYAFATAELLLSLPCSAMAEVCDKVVGESWMPEDGPVWFFNPVGFPFGPVILIGWLVLSLIVRKAPLGFIGVACVALMFFMSFFSFADDLNGSIHRAAIKEGCITERTCQWDFIILALLGVAYLAAGIRSRRLRVKTV